MRPPSSVIEEPSSVYYEVGFAHAIGKRPIIYCRAGTMRHFDLSVHNCPEYPEYANITELRSSPKFVCGKDGLSVSTRVLIQHDMPPEPAKKS